MSAIDLNQELDGEWRIIINNECSNISDLIIETPKALLAYYITLALKEIGYQPIQDLDSDDNQSVLDFCDQCVRVDEIDFEDRVIEARLF